MTQPSIPPARFKMRRALLEPLHAPLHARARKVQLHDAESLARLMLEAYRGTVDDGEEGPAEALSEVYKLLQGGYGDFNAKASEVIEHDGEIVATTLVTEYQGAPLIAFSLTHPTYQRRGLARGGLLRTLEALRQTGHTQAFLAVTSTNLPALTLYESLGFQRV